MAALYDDDGDDEQGNQCVTDCLRCIAILAVVTSLIAILVLTAATLDAHFRPVYPRFSVAIGSASGLDLPSTTITDDSLPLKPEFNLTVRVGPDADILRAGRGGACMEAGMYVEVSYRCMPLAASAASTRALCTGPREPWKEAAVVARGAGVRLPGYLMDSLAADLRNGVPAFDVTLRSGGAGSEDGRVKSCGGRAVGDDGALGSVCDAVPRCHDRDWNRRLAI